MMIAQSIAWLGKSTDDYLKYFRGIDYKIKKLQAISDQSLIVPYGDL